MKRFLISTLIGIWLVVAIITTISLLSFNDYRVTELGSYSFIAVDSDNLEPDFKKGDLLIADKTNPAKIKSGDDIFYYRGNSANVVNLGTVAATETISDTEYNYEMQEGTIISNEYVVGTTKDVKTIHNIGTLITILQSKWGFMFIVIFPTILLFVYELYSVVTEIRKDSKKKA